MKIGTLGTSFITESLIEAFLEAGNEVNAIHSRSIEKAEKLKEKYHAKKAYDDYDAMLKDEDVDTIYVGLPNALHYEYTKKALLNNKNVVLEKPFTATYEEALELRELAVQRHLYLFEAILTIHQPAVIQMKEDIKKLGALHLASFNFSKYSSKYDEFLVGKNPNIFNPEMAGGALMDMNIYNIHLSQYLFGKPLKYYYVANDEKGIDTSGVAILKYDNFIANLITAKDSVSKSGGIIMGEKGCITFDEATSIISKYTITYKDNTVEVHDFKGNNRYVNEINAMKKIVENDDYDKHLELLDYSLEVMKTLCEVKTNTIK